jgi:sugar-specific transcriptional regulator TrmB
MDKETLRDALEEAGLSGYQADAYITLLEEGMAPAVDVASQCSVPVSQIYNVLRQLEQMGYIETFEQNTLHARPKEPVTVLRDLRSRSELLDDAADSIEERWQQPALSEHKVSIVKQENTVIDRVRNHIREAESFVALSATVEQFRKLNNALTDAHERGVVVRVSVYPDEPIDDLLEEVEINRTVTELRVCRIPGPFLAIVDRSKTCFAPNTWANRPFGVLINDYILSFIFHWYFQTCLWMAWEPEYVETAPPHVYMTIKEFVRDLTPLWKDGASIDVTLHGSWIETGEECTVSGTVSDIFYPGVYTTDGAPSIEQLASRVTLIVRAEDEEYSIGGWGAVYEDIEARRIVLEGISYERAFEAVGDEGTADTDRMVNE